MAAAARRRRGCGGGTSSGQRDAYTHDCTVHADSSHGDGLAGVELRIVNGRSAHAAQAKIPRKTWVHGCLAHGRGAAVLPLVFAQPAAVSQCLWAVGMRGAAGELLTNFPPRPLWAWQPVRGSSAARLCRAAGWGEMACSGGAGGGCAAAALLCLQPPPFCACVLLSAASTQAACSAWQAGPALTHRHPRMHARFGRCQRQRTRRCSPSLTESSPPFPQPWRPRPAQVGRSCWPCAPARTRPPAPIAKPAAIATRRRRGGRTMSSCGSQRAPKCSRPCQRISAATSACWRRVEEGACPCLPPWFPLDPVSQRAW